MTCVLFDVGGVIVDWEPNFDQLDEFFGVDGEKSQILKDTFLANRDVYDTYLTGAEFWNRIATAVGHRELTETEVEHLCRIDGVEWCTTKLDTLSLINDLAATHRLGVLSNAPLYFANECRKSEWSASFDWLMFSWEEKMIKPDPALFTRCLERMGMEASDVIFLDDRPDNVEAARSLGMTAHVFSDAARARVDLGLT